MKKPSLLVIFLTVFIDLIGFGIVLPLLPVYSDQFGASGLVIGLILASFSAMQFVFSPVWGRLSDRIGRRPVLLLSTAMASCSYALFAVGSGRSEPTVALTIIFLSRVLAGICGANITVAQACVADVTPPELRSKKMGLIGVAFGLGFIFGPALGGFSIRWLGVTGPGWVAAGLCALNFLLAWMILPETRRLETTPVAQRPHLAQIAHVLRQREVGLLVAVFFLATFCFTCFETTLGLLIARNFHLTPADRMLSALEVMNRERFADVAATASFLFVWCGVIGALVQGGPLGRLVKRFGEVKLIVVSLVLVAVSLAPLPFVHGAGRFGWAALTGEHAGAWWTLLLLLAVLSIGSGLTRPPLFGLISLLTPADEQGATIGVAQSAGSLARILGPVFAAGLFPVNPALPYVICGGVCLLAALLAWRGLAGLTPAR
jgi:MFS family permease